MQRVGWVGGCEAGGERRASKPSKSESPADLPTNDRRACQEERLRK